jgi:hypothetical protein
MGRDPYLTKLHFVEGEFILKRVGKKELTEQIHQHLNGYANGRRIEGKSLTLPIRITLLNNADKELSSMEEKLGDIVEW